MDLLGQEPDEGLAGATGWSNTAREPAGRRRSAGIWILAVANLLLAVLPVLGIWFLEGARSYLLNDSAEFGSELEAARVGILVLKIACYALIGGFVLSALGVISLTRVGLRFQRLWAVLLCLTLVGALYGVPVLVFLRRWRMRSVS